ncbi:phage protein NinX family protein [Enterobacter sp.]|uniref:phage protein NinX family protein n=1 Tax=Enterobacter sp. TaxID=42895 RepID=UPI00296FA7EE|nr:phage protein NinX family protein [Enterobacter sp.]
MDYSQLSDRDIDALVLQRVYGNQAKDKDIMRAWLRGGFKFTTNPADAWPIMEANEIGIVKTPNGWCATNDDAKFEGVYFIDKKPLRAAMIVFLMMQEERYA